jgi:hypothetical protein
MHIKVHSIFISLLFFITFGAQAQSGLNFQGVARNTNNVILASQPISLRLSILQGSATGTTEYSEIRKVTTNAQGLFSVVIGDQDALSSIGNFNAINWKNSPKFLKIEMDVTAGNNFLLLGTTQFQSVAYAQFANSVDAEKLNGIVPVEKGGTGTTSLAAFKTALSIDKNTVGLSNVNNTADTAKPISNATKVALDTKVSTLTFSNTLAIKADTSELVLKAPIASPTFTGTVAGITKEMVGLSAVDNTSDINKPISTATHTALDSKVSSTTFSITLNTKVSTETFSSTIASKEDAANKSTATDLGAASTSDILFPTQKAVKSYVDAQSNAGGVADGGITTIKLADAAVTDAKIGTGISKAKVGLENVDNTADADKPISTAVADALNLKASTNVANVFTERQSINGTLGILIPNTDNHYWYFDEDEQLIFPNSTKIETGTATETIIRNSLNSDFSIITADMNGSKSWIFDKEGYMRFPGGDNIENDEYRFAINTEYKRFQIQISDPINETSMYWSFWEDSSLELPNGTKIETGTNTETVIRNTPNADFYIATSYLDDHDSDENTASIQIVNNWKFTNQGNLIFPNLTSFTPDYEGTGGFGINIAINKSLFINTENEDDQYYEWEFDKNGILVFPDGTTLAGNYSGTTYFELKTGDNDGFKITNSDDPEDPKTWKFDLDGKLTLPDGTEMGGTQTSPSIFKLKSPYGINIVSGESGETSMGASISISPYNGQGEFQIKTREIGGNEVEITKLWSYDSQGKLSFPDLTVASGNISNTGNFGFDTRANENGFSLITAGTLSGTSQLWSYNTDGSLTFPDGTITSGNISGTSNFGFDTRASEGGFTIITGTNGSTTQWTFDTDGSLKRNNISVLNFQMEEFKVTSQGSDITNPQSPVDIRVDSNNDYIWKFELEHTPISIRKTAFYINGTRLSQTQYSLSNNVITFDIRIWDYPPSGNYQFYIDYQY